jgi:hypothetical protein
MMVVCGWFDEVQLIERKVCVRVWDRKGDEVKEFKLSSKW